MRTGRFRGELGLLRDLLRKGGRRAEIGALEQTSWDGGRLRFDGDIVAFVVNRSTDFLWEGKAFEAMRTAYGAGTVYAGAQSVQLRHAATSACWSCFRRRSGTTNSGSTPKTGAWLRRARAHRQWSGRRGRLRRLVKQGVGYVAQKHIGKPRLETDNGPLWTDLRVWVYRGAPYLASGRASTRPDRLDLAPPGGWLPTYVRQ